MKKKILGVLMLTLLVASTFTFATTNIEGYISEIKLFLNGERVDKEIVIIGESSYLPVRAISEALGLDVGWNGETETITLDAKETNSSSDAVAKEMLGIMEDSNEKLDVENKALKALLEKNSIQVPTEDSVEKFLNEVDLKYFSKEGSKYLQVLSGFNDSKSKYADILGNKFSNYVIVNVWGNSGHKGTLEVNYAANGQYDKFKATFSPYNEDKVSIYRDLVIYVDGKEVLRKNYTDKTMPEDIEVDIKGGKVITIKSDVPSSSMGGFILGNPRFTIN